MGAPAATRNGVIGVLELGTNSLKLHLSKDSLEPTDPVRVEWNLGFEVFSSRTISEQTMETALCQVRGLLKDHGISSSDTPVVGFATGAFRDAENTVVFLERLLQEEGIPVRILRMEEEASLLIEGASPLVPEGPGMVFDLGGGSLEMVYFGFDGSWIWKGLPLGAIRIHQLACLASGGWDDGPALRWVDKALQHARAFNLATIHGTGGTVKAIAQVAGRSAVSIEEIRAFERAVRAEGPPASLPERRRTLFLPGLLVVRRLMERVGARMVRHIRVDLGEALLERLRPFRGALRGPACRSVLFQHLELFRPGVPKTNTMEAGDGMEAILPSTPPSGIHHASESQG